MMTRTTGTMVFAAHPRRQQPAAERRAPSIFWEAFIGDDSRKVKTAVRRLETGRWFGKQVALRFRAVLKPAVLVQIGKPVEKFHIGKETLSIGRTDSIPDSGRSGILEAELREIELTLANAVHQLDA